MRSKDRSSPQLLRPCAIASLLATPGVTGVWSDADVLAGRSRRLRLDRPPRIPGAPIAPPSRTIGSASPSRPGLDEQVEHVADRPFPAGRLAQRQVLLDVIAVPPAVLLLDDVPGGRE